MKGKLFRSIAASGILFAVVCAPIRAQITPAYAKQKPAMEKQVKKTVRNVTVFRHSNMSQKEKAKLIFYKDLPHIAYMDINKYFKLFFPKNKITVKQKKKNPNIYTLTSPTGKATVDVKKETLKTPDYVKFFNLMNLDPEGMDNGYLDGEIYIKSFKGETDPKNAPVKLSFKKYNIDLRADGEHVYLPVATLSDLYSDLGYHYAFYCGRKMYVNDQDIASDYSVQMYDPDYEDALNDSFSQRKKTPDLVKFNYDELCFAIDHFYGNPRETTPLHDLLAEKKSLDVALKSYQYSSEEGFVTGKQVRRMLLSTDRNEYILGLKTLRLLLDDGGHTAFGAGLSDDLYDVPDEAKEGEYYTAYQIMNERYISDLNSWKVADVARKKERHAAYGVDDFNPTAASYREKGDTAVCVLDLFIYDENGREALDDYIHAPLATRVLPTLEDGSVEHMINILDALKKASENPQIKYLVFDVSNNGGGSQDIALATISLMAGDGKAMYWSDNLLTKQRNTSYYKVDRNFDGVFDEKDDEVNYGNLKFAVLTSDYSFSCATFLPALAKEAGIPIMGEKSGGGACAIQEMAMADGFPYQLSSSRDMQVDSNGVNIDGGVPVDIDLFDKNEDGSDKTVEEVFKGVTYTVKDYSNFYDIDRLSSELNKWYER